MAWDVCSAQQGPLPAGAKVYGFNWCTRVTKVFRSRDAARAFLKARPYSKRLIVTYQLLRPARSEENVYWYTVPRQHLRFVRLIADAMHPTSRARKMHCPRSLRPRRLRVARRPSSRRRKTLVGMLDKITATQRLPALLASLPLPVTIVQRRPLDLALAVDVIRTAAFAFFDFGEYALDATLADTEAAYAGDIVIDIAARWPRVGFREAHTLLQDAVNGSHRLIIASLTIFHSKDEAHSNLLVVDTAARTVERFEPHGSHSDLARITAGMLKPGKLRNYVWQAANTRLASRPDHPVTTYVVDWYVKRRVAGPLGFTYIAPQDDVSCPIQGLYSQRFDELALDTHGLMRTEQCNEATGNCQLWIVLYALLRASNPHMLREAVHEALWQWSATDDLIQFPFTLVAYVMSSLSDESLARFTSECVV